LIFDLLIHHAAEVVTCDGPLHKDATLTLAPIANGSVGIVGGRIAWLGVEVPPDCVGPNTVLLDARGGFVGPGFVDCHTHVVFAGNRADEFEARCQGKTYLEIAAAGGGIASTVRATREATEDELVALALPRLGRLLQHGVTTAEVKSGYGLTVEAELRMLQAIARLDREQPISLVATVLPLHALPAEFATRRADWLRVCIEQLLPSVARLGLARFCDAFVEQTAFTHDEARQVLTAAGELGFALRLHVDQLTANDGAKLAAELHAVSADHLEQVSPEGIAALKAAGTVAVLAPTSTLFAKARPFAPGRALRDAGIPVALCTNCNPGSSMSENVFLAMGLGCVENGLTPAEAYLGFTRMAALALADPSLGRLAVGGPADLVVYATPSYRQLPYHFAVNDVASVMKQGKLVSTCNN
jgi:imidazolonepropionase